MLPEAISESYFVNTSSVLTILKILMLLWQNLYSALTPVLIFMKVCKHILLPEAI
jgi:hypothetical protein